MALMKSANVPDDAVLMDELEATAYAWDIVENWKHMRDTWALQYSPVVLGGINAVSGLLINNHYRNKLKIGSYGYLASALPISVMPGLLTALFHRHMVSTGMLLMKNEACPICYEVRSAAIQVGFGIGYPMLLGPTAALMLSSRYSTYRVPELREGFKIFFQFVRKITRPFTGTLVVLASVQCLASSLLTYFEMRNCFTMRRKMFEIEAKLKEEDKLK